MKTLSLTTLQNQLLQIISSILDTGIPVEIEYQGRKVRIVAVEEISPTVTERLIAKPLFTHPVEFDTPTEWTWNEMKNL
jgi:hypothetical protein